MPVPYTFGTATAAIPLSQLDSNFSTAVTIGNTAVQLGNTVTTLNNITLANVTVSSGNSTVTKETVTTITSPTATNLTLQSAGTTAVTIDTSQNVGIGTTLPTYKLEVQTTSASGVRITSATSDTYIIPDFYGVGVSSILTGAGGSKQIAFGNSSTERMRIDSSGNLLVGTNINTGSGKLTVAGGINSVNGALNVAGNGGFYNSSNKFGVDNNAGASRLYSSGANSSTRGSFEFHITDSVGTLDTTAMTLDASGNLLVGTTTAIPSANGFTIAGSGSAGTYFNVGHQSGVPSGNYFGAFYYNNSAIGSITQSGTTAVLYNTTSDQRLKDNIQDADSASTLIDSLKVRQFDWKTDNSHQRYGFIAQELVTVAPEAVHQPTNKEDMMAVDYSKLVPMLVKEIQSLRTRLTALENK
jgi:hypothetical protein